MELRNHIDCADELVEKLDGKPQNIEKNQYRSFCTLYVIILFRTYNDPECAEFLLAMCGFLDGFNSVSKISERETMYWECVKETNHLFRKRKCSGGSINTTLRGVYKNLIAKLDKELSKQIKENTKNEDDKGKLGLMQYVVKEFKKPNNFNQQTNTLILPKLPLQSFQLPDRCLEESMEPNPVLIKKSMVFRLIQVIKEAIITIRFRVNLKLMAAIFGIVIIALCCIVGIKIYTSEIKVAKMSTFHTNVIGSLHKELDGAETFSTNEYIGTNSLLDKIPKIIKEMQDDRGAGEYAEYTIDYSIKQSDGKTVENLNVTTVTDPIDEPE